MKRTNTATWIESRNRWQINVQKDGIRKTFTSSKPGRAGQRECNAKADAWLDDGITNNKAKVSTISKDYLDDIQLTSSSTHYKQYSSYFNTWINPTIGTIKIENLTEQHLQSVINKAFASGKSKKTLSNIRGCMLNFLKFCRACKLTTLYVETLKIPRGATVNEKVILQPSDIKTLFASEQTSYNGKDAPEIYINAYRLQVVTGLRPGELFGLKWTDIKRRVLYLTRSINAQGEITRGKNDNAQRTIYLTDIALAILQDQKQLLKNNDLKSEYIFCNRECENIKTRDYNKRLQIYCEYNNITVVTPYELRHTFVSAIKTIPEGYLKQIVGHSKDMDTYGTYSHDVDGDDKAAAQLIQNIFCKIITSDKL